VGGVVGQTPAPLIIPESNLQTRLLHQSTRNETASYDLIAAAAMRKSRLKERGNLCNASSSQLADSNSRVVA
jgi:hypothetical protein